MRAALGVFGLCSLLSLTGCLTAEELAAREKAEQAARESEDDAYCRKLSAQPGTPAYVQCRLSKDQMRQQQSLADQAASQAYQRQIQQTYLRSPVNCTSTTTFGTTNTTCY